MTTKDERLHDALRAMRTDRMTAGAVVHECRQAVPEASVRDIRAALRRVGDERLREGHRLRRAERVRWARVCGVADSRGAA